MKAETCSHFILLINFIWCIKVVLDYKIVHILLVIEDKTGMSHLKIRRHKKNILLNCCKYEFRPESKDRLRIPLAQVKPPASSI